MSSVTVGNSRATRRGMTEKNLDSWMSVPWPQTGQLSTMKANSTELNQTATAVLSEKSPNQRVAGGAAAPGRSDPDVRDDSQRANRDGDRRHVQLRRKRDPGPQPPAPEAEGHCEDSNQGEHPPHRESHARSPHVGEYSRTDSL